MALRLRKDCGCEIIRSPGVNVQLRIMWRNACVYLYVARFLW